MAERIVIVGGGAAGFFAAIACARAKPENEVTIYERGSQFLTKVRISGGGRCNVTHACFDPREFSSRYPRGERELISALHRFGAGETAAWFEARGVALKTEPDGRMFPVTDSSATIIDCLVGEAGVAGVKMRTRVGIERVDRDEAGGFVLTNDDGDTSRCDRVLLATGGARGTGAARIAESLGHTIEPPVPSLFSLHVPLPWLQRLPGIGVADAEISIPKMKLCERGPLLVTHNGISGPAVLRLSAWGARPLHAYGYQIAAHVKWLPEENEATLTAQFGRFRDEHPKRRVENSPIHPLPSRLWVEFVALAGIPAETVWTNLSRPHARALTRLLLRTELPIEGKSLNKDEFVTCGGVRLREINLKTMESRITPRLYFAGELLDIDGITGGFNFQAAWTTGWIAGHAMADAELP